MPGIKFNQWLVFCVLIIIFSAIEFRGLFHFDNSDENIYYYMGHLVSEGKIPYRDFFFSHPPLQLVPNAIIFFLLGFKLPLLKLVQLLSVIITALFIFRLMKKNFGAKQALASAAIFLFAHRVLLEATYDLGVNLAAMLLVVSLYYVFDENFPKAGVFAGLAALTSLLALVPAIAVGLVLLFRNKGFLKYCLYVALVFGIVNLAMYFIAGENYFRSVYFYHLLKPAAEGNSLNIFTEILKANIILVVSALLFIFYRTKKLITAWLPATAYLIFLLLAVNKIFNFYFILAFPLLSMLGGYSLARLAGKFPGYKAVVYALFLVALITSAFFAVKYQYSVDFKDFETAPQIATFIKQNSNADDTIFGDSTSVPLIALLSGRRIALDRVDTNEMTFLSGIIGENDTISSLRAAKPKFVVVRPLYGIGSLEFFSKYLNEECEFVNNYKDPYWGDFLVYDCSGAPID